MENILTPTAIEISGVHKSFKIHHDKGHTLKEKLLFGKKRSRFELREVLSDITLSIEKGDVVGLIGENGCGKSTLLKLISRIMYPNAGDIRIRGRVSSLLELGAGFHPDLTGRENIYTNASIFGLSRQEINHRLLEIIEFSELQDYIDNPVRTYSSGMYMRLAFSVAINVDADIILIDEILAVGDTNFQAKCFENLRRLKHQGKTIVIVTHDTGSIEKLCNRAVWLHNGQIEHEGKPFEVIDRYLSYMNDKRAYEIGKLKPYDLAQTNMASPVEAGHANTRTGALPIDQSDVDHSREEQDLLLPCEKIDVTANRFGSREIEIEDAFFLNDRNLATRVLHAGRSACIEIHFIVNCQIEECVFGIGIFTTDDVVCYGNNTQLDRLKVCPSRVKGQVRFKMPSLDLLAGSYKLNVAVVDVDGRPLDFIRNYMEFTVVSDDKSIGIFPMRHEWEIQDA